MGHVVGWALLWSGLAVQVVPPVQPAPTVPRPPPNCPTITSEVGTLLLFKNVRLFVRLIVRLVVPVVATGTVITTGDHPAGEVSVAAGAAGFKLTQVAVDPVTAAPQL
jgi:hypothetical protein